MSYYRSNHEGPCCPACMKVAAVLKAEGKTDDLYAGEVRCCCLSARKASHPTPGEDMTPNKEKVLSAVQPPSPSSQHIYCS